MTVSIETESKREIQITLEWTRFKFERVDWVEDTTLCFNGFLGKEIGTKIHSKVRRSTLWKQTGFRQSVYVLI